MAEPLPERIDRYRVVGRLGAGGMGVVYEAVDPELNRPVAIKLLHRVHSGEGDSDTPKRLVREGQALAQLNHPHVVQVFGAGLDRGRVWLAMELVRGQTLKQWSTTHHSAPGEHVSDRLALLEQAGRGLTAAHARGLVHRDFKPDNVLVGDDGRVRVADFGLARMTQTHPDAADQRDPTAQSRSESERGPGMLHRAVTQTGAAVGTPRYMAPEQLQGSPADARSDQFALAVTAWELLHGGSPFGGAVGLNRLKAIEARQFETTRHPEVPHWMTAALQRAMAYRAARRFRSVDALLASMSTSSRRKRVAWTAATAALVVAGGALGSSWWDRPVRGARPCSEVDARQRLAQVWHPARRSAVFAGLRKTGVPYAVTTMRSVETEVEAFSDAWTSSFVAACDSTTLGRSMGRPAADAQHACLGNSLGALDGVVSRLESADAQQAERATEIIRKLRDPKLCAEVDTVATHVTRAADMSDRLATFEAAYVARDTSFPLAAIKAIAQEARRNDFGALEGDALRLLGGALLNRDDEEAGQYLERAYDVAVGSRMDVRARLSARLLTIHHARQDRTQAARKWLRRFAVASRRDGRNPRHDGEFHRLDCRVSLREGNIIDATEACERAVAVAQRGSGATTGSVWAARADLARAYRRGGRIAESARVEVLLRDEAARRLGRWHPRVGGMELNLGHAASKSMHHDQAMQHYMAALRVFRRAYGPRHRWVLSTLMNAAADERRAGNVVAAERLLLEAIDLGSGTRNTQLARLLNNLATAQSYQQRFDDALATLDRAQQLNEELLPPGHPQIATSLANRAGLLAAQGRFEDAMEPAEAALAIHKAAGERLGLLRSLRRIGRYRLALGQYAESRNAYNQALSTARSIGASPYERAVTLSGLAEALYQLGELELATTRCAQGIALLEDIDTITASIRGYLLFTQARVEAARNRVDGARILGQQAYATLLQAGAVRERERESEVQAFLAALPAARRLGAGIGVASRRSQRSSDHPK